MSHRTESPLAREMLVLTIVVALLAGLGVGAYFGLRRTGSSSGGFSTGSCGAVITEPTDRNRTHQAPQDLDYIEAPPSFGPHLAVPAPFGRSFYSAADRPAVGNLVHSMEHGYTIAWYDDTLAADEDAVAALKKLAEDAVRGGERFIAAPWTRADGDAFRDGAHFALTRWSADPDHPEDAAGHRGNWQYCGEVDREAVIAFLHRWSNAESPEPGVG